MFKICEASEDFEEKDNELHEKIEFLNQIYILWIFDKKL